jgi:hypothetical protein
MDTKRGWMLPMEWGAGGVTFKKPLRGPRKCRIQLLYARTWPFGDEFELSLSAQVLFGTQVCFLVLFS